MTEKPAARKKRKKSARGGRPKWAPTPEDRTTIERMKYCGESDDVISRAMGVDANTLRKHCANELKNGHSHRRREVIDLLFEAADKGNTTAIKRLEEVGRVAGAAQAMEELAASGVAPAPSPVKAPKLGKKEERKAAAQVVAASGVFQPPEPPKLIVDNTTTAVNE